MRLLQCGVLAVLLAACVVTSHASRDRRQTTSSGACFDYAGREGTCGSIRNCPHLLSLISGRRPTREEVRNLRASVCGPGLQVCCASEESPRSVDEHPNRAIVDRGTVCGTTFAGKILGGTEARLGQFPWLALLGYSEESSNEITYECGGALISDQYVLTAAHCISEQEIAPFRLRQVRLGEHDISQEEDCQEQGDGRLECNAPQDFNIVKVMVHESYNKPTQRMNDIALLRLDRPVNRNAKFISKVCLPFDEARLVDYTGTNLTVAGFGRTGPGLDEPSSDVLLFASVPGFDQQECKRIISSFRTGSLGPKQICAGGQAGIDSCSGDSGGPLTAFGRGGVTNLVGVVSFGVSVCGTEGRPSVNTRVTEYLDWILDRIEP